MDVIAIVSHLIISKYNIKMKDKHRQGNIGIVVYGRFGSLSVAHFIIIDWQSYKIICFGLPKCQ